MIHNAAEYAKAQEELRYMEAWLSRLQQESPGRAKGLTKVGVRKMIIRLHRELGTYEASREVEKERSP